MLVCDLLPAARNDIAFSESYLRASFQTTTEGSTVSHIPEVLKQAGIGQQYEYRRDLTLDDLRAALKRGWAIAGVYGLQPDDAHALIVEQLRDGWVGIRDPLPMAQGSAYRVRESDFLRVWLSPFDGRGRAVIVAE